MTNELEKDIDTAILKYKKKFILQLLDSGVELVLEINNEDARIAFQGFYSYLANAAEKQGLFEEIDLYEELTKIYAKRSK